MKSHAYHRILPNASILPAECDWSIQHYRAMEKSRSTRRADILTHFKLIVRRFFVTISAMSTSWCGFRYPAFDQR